MNIGTLFQLKHKSLSESRLNPCLFQMPLIKPLPTILPLIGLFPLRLAPVELSKRIIFAIGSVSPLPSCWSDMPATIFAALISPSPRR